ncbi:hypothetical protein MCOR02_000858 [Pyricularia oryzae]|nr:hypothetical protein MCOR02_000858 [Pyricularia oryzae]KAI6286631.1 hypothetical protein MCOR26_001019 [Pyricularia oryzae]KAI6484382.1 hypothetical protein MCOR11_010121 [Pyricularia oryzae]KAI6486014.1 hypothetical protein MCOR13_009538 [Pyricularia oryzae]
MITLEESRISGGDGMEPPVKALSELRDEFPFQDARQQNFPYRPLPGLEFRDGGTFLVPRGKLLDVIGAVGPTLPNKPTFMPGIAGIADVLRTWESLVITVADGFDGRVSDTHKPKQPGETKFL